MEKPPVNPVNKVELPKTEQQLEHFPLSEQEKNIREVFKLSPELETIALEATKPDETISLYRIENKNIEKEPDGITSHKDLKGQWFSPDLETALVYLRKSQQSFGIEAKRVEGANLVIVKVSKEEFENLHVSKHPIASQMDVENDNYIIPENIERNYINLDDVQDKVGNFENLQKAKEQIKGKVKQFETKEAVELYQEYLKTIFPESKVRDVVWHGNREDFKDSGFDKNKGRDNKFSDDGQFYGFYFGDFYSHYGRPGNISYPSLVNIKKLKIVDLEFDPILSGIDVTKNIKEQYKLTDEDGILQIGADHFNDNVSKEEYEKHDLEMQKKFLDFLSSKGKNFEEIEKGTQEISKQDVSEYLEKNGITSLGISELVVFEQEQIHILGSKADIAKFKEFVSKNEDSVLEKQELYQKIKSEIESVSISENDKDKEGNLLAPNGKKSNLPELEWKMARTPSFLKFFGNWKEKYNKEQYDLWLKYQEKQTYEDYIKSNQNDKETQKNNSFGALANIREDKEKYDNDGKWEAYHLSKIKEWEDFYQKHIVRLSHKVSKLQAELINSGFNTHSTDLDYTKVLDENGEPLLLYRGTDFNPDENGKFVIPKKKIDGNEFEVGVFFGNEEEAKHHHEGRKIEGKTSKLYKVFVNGRNFRIFDSKPNYWANPKDSQEWRGKYDGVWVKQNENEETRTDTKVNLFDYIAFNPDDVLIVDVE